MGRTTPIYATASIYHYRTCSTGSSYAIALPLPGRSAYSYLINPWTEPSRLQESHFRRLPGAAAAHSTQQTGGAPQP